jgi:hypothetical protein
MMVLHPLLFIVLPVRSGRIASELARFACARWDFTAARLPAERRHVSGGSTNVDHHLYALAQELLQVGGQTPGKPRRGIARHVDQQVHIAFRRVFPPSRRAEYQYVSRAVEGGHPQDFFAVL